MRWGSGDRNSYSDPDLLHKVAVVGHSGPHSEAYHQAVFDRLDEATRGLSGDAYSAAFRSELQSIKQDLTTPGTNMYKLLLGQ